MERTAEIGASVIIKGDLTAHEDIVISGRVEGTVSVEDFRSRSGLARISRRTSTPEQSSSAAMCRGH